MVVKLLLNVAEKKNTWSY